MVWQKILERQSKQTGKCSQDIPGYSNEAGGFQVIGRYSKTTAYASGNRMLQNLKDFNSMPFMSKRNSAIRSRKEIIMSQLLLKMTDGENARQCANNTQRPEIGTIQGHTHQLMQNKKLVLS